jgi:glycosyltransferase involved in cell wall biosynthesis
MKGLYLHFFGLRNFSGISKKILYQIDSLERNGVEMSFCSAEIDNEGFQNRVCNGDIIEAFGNNFFSKFKKWLLFGKVEKYIKDNGITFLYVRSFYNTNPFLLSFFSNLKKRGVKIVMEYPTYPYDLETKSEHFRYQPIFSLNRVFRKFLKGRVDKIVTFTDLKTIDGVSCINISNAIDFNSVALTERPVFNGTDFFMLAVAEVHFWHGYDRVIHGLRDYYNKEEKGRMNVHFDIVGEGDINDRKKLVELVKELSLEGYVHFHDNSYGKELDHFFSNSHFAIASLARHRTGIADIKTLKNREYAARGIPFVYSENDSDFDNMDYVLKIAPDETPLDIGKIIDFYIKLNPDPAKIRESVSDTLNWDVQMKKVISSIGLDLQES